MWRQSGCKSGTEVELGVICTGAEIDVVFMEDIAMGKKINDTKEGAQDKALNFQRWWLINIYDPNR